MDLGASARVKFMGLVANWIWGEGRRLSRLPVDFWFVDREYCGSICSDREHRKRSVLQRRF